MLSAFILFFKMLFYKILLFSLTWPIPIFFLIFWFFCFFVLILASIFFSLFFSFFFKTGYKHLHMFLKDFYFGFLGLSFGIFFFLFLWLYYYWSDIDFYFFNNMLHFSLYTFFTFVLTLLFCFFFFMFSFFFITKKAVLFSVNYLHGIMLTMFLILLLLFSNNLLLTILCLESISFCSYFLIVNTKTSVWAVEAGLRYFILGGISSGLFLFGASLLHMSHLTLNYNELFFDMLLKNNIYFYFDFSKLSPLQFFMTCDFFNLFSEESYTNLLTLLGVLFIVIGFFFKLGVAPFHYWISDVYDGSALPTVSFFATVLKGGIFFHFINLLHGPFYGYAWFLSPLFEIVGLCSVLWGAFAMTRQTKIKRFFAYSSISHTGFILLALSTFLFDGYIAAVFYLVNYLFLSIFYFSLFLFYMQKLDLPIFGNEVLYFSTFSREKLNITNDTPRFYLLFTGCLCLLLFIFAGIPPFSGFFMKYHIFLVFLKYKTFSISFILLFGGMLFSSILSAYNYLRIIKQLLIDFNLNTIKVIKLFSFFDIKRTRKYYDYLSAYLKIFLIYLVFIFLTWNIFFLKSLYIQLNLYYILFL